MSRIVIHLESLALMVWRESISVLEQGQCASPPNNEVMAGRAVGGPKSFCGGGEFFVRPDFSRTD